MCLDADAETDGLVSEARHLMLVPADAGQRENERERGNKWIRTQELAQTIQSPTIQIT